MGMGDHSFKKSCTAKGPVTECPWSTESAHRVAIAIRNINKKALVAIGLLEHRWPSFVGDPSKPSIAWETIYLEKMLLSVPG
eukprot:scaffold18710_cov20-Tisochrysis_lutea.AAC.3